MAGYSGTPLPKKLGIRAGHRVFLDAAPEGFPTTLGELPDGVAIGAETGEGGLDVALVFARWRAELRERFPRAAAALHPRALRVAWPKRAAKVPTDLTEDVVRGVGLARGMVDVKVCAIDETWSGPKLVVRLADRPRAR